MEHGSIVDSALEQAVEAVYIRDLDRGLLYMNAAAEALTGWTREEALSQKCFEVFGSRGGECRFTCPVDRAMGEGRPIKHQEGELVARDGTVNSLRVSISPLARGDRMVGALVMMCDVTASEYQERARIKAIIKLEREVDRRARMEAELSRRDGILAACAAASVSVPTDDESEVRWLDDLLSALGRAVGVSRTYLAEDRAPERGEPAAGLRQQWLGPGVDGHQGCASMERSPWVVGGLERWRRLLRGDEVVKGLVRDLPAPEQELLSSRGVLAVAAVPVWVGDYCWGVMGFDDCRKERIWSAAEVEALRLSAALIGASLERRQAEVRSRQLADLLERSLAEMYVFHAETLRFILVNRGARENLGYRMEDLEHLSPLDLKPEISEAEFRALMEPLSSGEEALRRFQTVHLRKDGTTYPVDVTLQRGELGDTPVFVAFIVDTTERQQLELEQLRAQKLELVGQLAGGIAHDFNNLLAGLLSQLELARLDTDPAGHVHESLTLCCAACDRASDLTNQLLTFARGGAPQKGPTDLGPLLRESTHLATVGTRARVRFDLPRELPVVEVDKGQISQVLHNLVLNAVQAMPHGGDITVGAGVVELDVRGAPASLREGTYVSVEVQDEGDGIPDELLDRVFDPYFTTKPKGSGLGLTTCYAIVRNHDGQLELASETGVGTRATVLLPAAEGGLSVEDAPAVPVRGRGRILFMDDDDFIRSSMERILARLGYDVICTAHGEETIATYEQAPAGSIDLVLLDLTVKGGLGGVETLRRLLDIDPEVRAIVCSGYSEDPVLAEPSSYGFQGRIAKPFSLSGAAAEIARVMALRSSEP